MANIQVPPAVGSSGQFLDAIVITSSTLRQIVMVGDPSSTGAFAPVTSSFGGLVNFSSGGYTIRSLSSGTVTLSSNPTVVSASSGLVQLTSAPLVIVATSGGTIPVSLSTVFSLSSTPLVGLTGTSSAQIPGTSSGGLFAQITNPTTAVTISNTSFTVNLTTAVSLSSAPLVIVATSGGTIPVSLSTVFSLSSTPIVQTASSSLVAITSGTVTLSSAPTVVNASSGVVGTLASTTKQYTVFQFNASSSNSLTNLTTANVVFHGWNAGNQTTSATAAIKCYDSTTATVGSTTNLKLTIALPGGSAGAGSNLILPQGVNFTSGITIVVTGNYASTSTGTTHSAGDVIGAFYYV